MTKSPTAGRLLRGLAFMVYWAQVGRLTTAHVPGVEDVMADIASRPCKAQQLFKCTSALSDIDFRSSDASNGAQLAEIQCLQDAAWEAIGTATVDGSERHRYWKAWQMHCGLYQDATGEIQAPHILTDRLLTFAFAVWEGQYGKGHQVQVQSVEFAL